MTENSTVPQKVLNVGVIGLGELAQVSIKTASRFFNILIAQLLGFSYSRAE